MTKPDWITVDADNSRLIGAAGSFSGATQAAANAAAQNSLNNWGDAAIADGSLFCYDFPVLDVTIPGFAGEFPINSTWDEDNQRIWTSWGVSTFAIPPTVVSGIDVNTNAFVEFTPSTGNPQGIQYLGDYTGAFPGNKLYCMRTGAMSHFLPTAPYTQTNDLVLTVANASGRPQLWIPEKDQMWMINGTIGTVPQSMRVSRVDFQTGVLTETVITTAKAGGVDYLHNLTYNPELNEIICGTSTDGFTTLNVDTLVKTEITFAGGRVTDATRCQAYCPDNGMIYSPYRLGTDYGVAIVRASDNTIYAYQSLSTTVAPKAIVYHPARKYVYVFGTNTLTIVDTAKYADGAAMVLGVVPFVGTVSWNTAAYCPLNRNVYMAPQGSNNFMIFT